MKTKFYINGDTFYCDINSIRELNNMLSNGANLGTIAIAAGIYDAYHIAALGAPDGNLADEMYGKAATVLLKVQPIDGYALSIILNRRPRYTSDAETITYLKAQNWVYELYTDSCKGVKEAMEINLQQIEALEDGESEDWI